MRASNSAKRRPGAHIAITGVQHRYRRSANETLRDITLEVQPCESVAVVGRSGCGKSTLLHIVAGLIAPSAGEVRIDGALVQGPSPLWTLMFQQPHLYPWMTVEQNAGLGLKFAGVARREIKVRVGELLEMVALAGYAGRNVQELSGGEQQRVALARSLAVRPEVLLLDEPFSALDMVTRRALQRDVRRIVIDLGITLVIVTHDISEAVATADRAIVMKPDPGRIAEIITIDTDPQDRERRGAGAVAVQAKLQAAFERTSGLSTESLARIGPENLKILAAGHR